MEKLIDKIRERIKEKGFMAAMEIVDEFSQDIIRVEATDPKEILNKLTNDEIRSLEYANAATVGIRRKDLFYFNPDVE